MEKNKTGTIRRIAHINFQKWTSDSRIMVLALVVFIFTFYNLWDLLKLSFSSGLGITPWILPHYMVHPVVLFIYGFFIITFFSGAPFEDPFSGFVRSRTGKRLWIGGQVLYIVESAFVFVCYQYAVILIIILPRLLLIPGWGKLITQCAFDEGFPQTYGITLSGIWFNQSYVSQNDPIKLTLTTICLMWAVCIFFGLMIFCLQILFGKGIGVICAGCFCFICYFSVYWGLYTFGEKILCFSPLSWICYGYLSGTGSGTSVSFWYAGTVLLWGSILFAETGKYVYCRKE